MGIKEDEAYCKPKFDNAAEGAVDQYKKLDDKARNLYNINMLGLKRTLKGHIRKVNCLSWKVHAGAPTLVGADQGNRVIVWDAKSGMKRQIYSSSFVMSADLHPKKDFIVIGSMQNVCALVDMSPSNPEGVKKRDFAGHDGYIGSVKFTGTEADKMVSAGGDAEVKYWDVERGQEISTFYGHETDAGSISFPSGDSSWNIFCTGSTDKTVKMWDIRQSMCTMTFKAEGEVNCCAMYPDGMGVVAGCETCNRSAQEGKPSEKWEAETGAATFFDVRSGASLVKFTRRKQKCTNIVWSVSGRMLFISYEDGNVGMWDPWTEGGIKHKIPAHCNATAKDSIISAMAISPDGSVLATGGFDSTIKIWGPGTGPE